jgi:hypothetical protein
MIKIDNRQWIKTTTWEDQVVYINLCDCQISRTDDLSGFKGPVQHLHACRNYIRRFEIEKVWLKMCNSQLMGIVCSCVVSSKRWAINANSSSRALNEWKMWIVCSVVIKPSMELCLKIWWMPVFQIDYPLFCFILIWR